MNTPLVGTDNRVSETGFWVSAVAVAVCVALMAGLIGLITVRGLAHFWPADLVAADVRLGHDQEPDASGVLGRLVRVETTESRTDSDGGGERWLFQVGNRDVGQSDFVYLRREDLKNVRKPQTAVVWEREEWGPMIGYLSEVQAGSRVIRSEREPDRAWNEMQELIAAASQRRQAMRDVEKQVQRLHHVLDSADASAAATARVRFERLLLELQQLRQGQEQNWIRVRLASGATHTLSAGEILQAYRPNAMSVLAKLAHYVGAFAVFLTEGPREANTEGGVFPAIFGTVLMVILMSIVVTPMGVLAAVYLHEYASGGPMTRALRIVISNLAGVPSIVYGVFGLGFFVYSVGGSIDAWLFADSLPTPTFGTGGLLWASLTLAILTLPVVIISTEEGLSRIPMGLRHASMALGATRAETLWKVVLPVASPAMMTGLILAVARAAGEVAPLMLVGVVKLAPELPVDDIAPFLHLERKFMHLGFHIYDVALQSPHVEASRSLIYATTLLLLVVVLSLNGVAVRIRHRLRERFRSLDSL